MREIKFRAWDKEYENMYQNAYPFEHLVYVEMFDDDETFERFKHKMMMVNGKYFYFIVSKDIALMQFTGLLDSHDKEIYESDVVEITELYGDQQRAEVFWGPVDNSYQWMNGETWLLRFTSGAQGPLYPYCRPVNHYQLEVIGNIYEHSNLLKGSDHEGD